MNIENMRETVLFEAPVVNKATIYNTMMCASENVIEPVIVEKDNLEKAKDLDEVYSFF